VRFMSGAGLARSGARAFLTQVLDLRRRPDVYPGGRADDQAQMEDLKACNHSRRVSRGR
jgi:hypothetical protein